MAALAVAPKNARFQRIARPGQLGLVDWEGCDAIAVGGRVGPGSDLVDRDLNLVSNWGVDKIIDKNSAAEKHNNVSLREKVTLGVSLAMQLFERSRQNSNHDGQ